MVHKEFDFDLLRKQFKWLVKTDHYRWYTADDRVKLLSSNCATHDNVDFLPGLAACIVPHNRYRRRPPPPLHPAFPSSLLLVAFCFIPVYLFHVYIYVVYALFRKLSQSISTVRTWESSAEVSSRPLPFLPKSKMLRYISNLFKSCYLFLRVLFLCIAIVPMVVCTIGQSYRHYRPEPSMAWRDPTESIESIGTLDERFDPLGGILKIYECVESIDGIIECLSKNRRIAQHHVLALRPIRLVKHAQ